MRLFLISFSLILTISLTGQTRRSTPVFDKQATPWADSLLSAMSVEEKVGQLFMVAAYSNRDEAHVREIEGLIRDHQIGGLILMQGGPSRQLELTYRFQELSKTPLLLSMDAEWGLGMRLDSTMYFPRQMALGATFNEDLVYEFGLEQAKQLQRLGVHVSFSPVVDVNSNPANPVIGNRSFGENKEWVGKLGVAYMEGLQAGGVLANAKHFPGHGDTDSDSHKTLPSILHSAERMDSLELYPFKRLIRRGVGSMMVAHLNIPSLDSSGLPSTLSSKIAKDLLRDSLGFEGLVFTDALNMRGIADYAAPGDAEYQALLAGNDVLLFAGDVPKAKQRILQALSDGSFTEEQLDKHVLRILKAKEWCGLNRLVLPKKEGVHAYLHRPAAIALQRRVTEASITILKNDRVLPVNTSKDASVAILNMGGDIDNAFSKRYSELADADIFYFPKSPDFRASQKIEQELSQYDLVIVNILDASNRPSKNWGVPNQSVRIINALNTKTRVHVNLFTNPYALKNMRGIEKVNGLMICYHDDPVVQTVAAEVVLGSALALGKLPVSCGPLFPFGTGKPLDQRIRLGHLSPEAVGIRTEDLARIDSIALEGIEEQAYPGCRVFVAKEGNIILDRSYGYQTYENKIPVASNTVYDLASITKIVSSTAAIMRLQDEGKLDIDYSLCDYIEVPDTSVCYNINLREMLSHYAQLPAWIPFYMRTIDKGKLNPSLYRSSPTRGFTTKVAESLYIRDSYADTIRTEINGIALRPEKEYKYSDLGYYFIQQMIEKITGLPIEEYVDSVFYKPLGLQTMGYHPLDKLPIEQIAPTEYDMLFRKQLVHGYVHDPGAAMLGGAGGHAGVFSNAYDLAVMMQMFMDQGTYGGKTYIAPATLADFTTCHYCDDANRRGVGFDKPSSEPDSGPTCNDASASSFGHSGFTGTLAWADPEEDLVYVFLSNRVYPNAENRKLLKMNIRTEIQQVIYDAIRLSKQREHQELIGDLGK